jgi:hypothetical protein
LLGDVGIYLTLPLKFPADVCLLDMCQGVPFRSRIAKVWLTQQTDKCHFFGLRSDTEFAGCLIVSLERLVRERQQSRDGRSLVMVKNAIVTREFEKLDMKLGSDPRRGRRCVQRRLRRTRRSFVR